MMVSKAGRNTLRAGDFKHDFPNLSYLIVNFPRWTHREHPGGLSSASISEFWGVARALCSKARARNVNVSGFPEEDHGDFD